VIIAQDVPPVAAAQTTEASAAQAAPESATPVVAIPVLTPVKLVLKQNVGSKISTGGEMFAFTLAEPLLIDGREIVPAGTPGMGEVIHAKKGGGSGSAGELVLAARYLQVGDRRLRLRSLQVAEAGKDKIGTVNALAPVPVVGMFGFLVKGKEIDLPEGTLLHAKTAEDFALPAPGASPSPVSPPTN
jgi:hypothetical protein